MSHFLKKKGVFNSCGLNIVVNFNYCLQIFEDMTLTNKVTNR